MKNPERTIERLLSKIDNNESFHEQIPTKNKFVFNKIVPYVFVYRQVNEKDPMLSDLVKSEYAYITLRDTSFDCSLWFPPITQKLAEKFGSCLIVEAWTAEEQQTEDINIHVSRKNVLAVAQYLSKQLESQDGINSVSLITSSKTKQPHNISPLLSLQGKKNNDILYIGLSIRPNYLSTGNREALPLILRQYREAISKSLSKTFFEFVRIHTSTKPTSFKINHPNELVPLVMDIDHKLAKESQRFDFLLLTTPINTHEAWLQFKKDRYHKTPIFQYRPMPIDPDMIKRSLYNLRIEDLYDPTIAYLFRDKRKELDHMLNMLSERGKEGFLHGSLQVFGPVTEQLLERARAILIITKDYSQFKKKEEKMLSAEEFASLAQQEISFLHRQDSRFNTTIRIRDDIYGVMVNQGTLNISRQYSISQTRAHALIQHEVGTHIVTYFNGKQQPFNVFRLGVPGYEKLQEGLAVLAEYMVGGLTNQRLRILAGRVVAVHHMLSGNTFLKTFSLLVEQHQFDKETAFSLTMRVYRSGGLTKDALYLDGLISLIEYIKQGKNLKLLTIGKIREEYIPIVEELTLKGVLNPPKLTPRYLSETYTEKLNTLKNNKGVFQMIQ